MFTFLEENDMSIGIRTDLGYEIQLDEVHVGYIYASVLEDDILFVEWIELDPEQQGKHYLRQILSEYMQLVCVQSLLFECGNEKLAMYQHLGSEILDYDNFRETYRMKLEYSNLQTR